MKTATTIILFVFICCVFFSCKKTNSGGECEEPIDIRYYSGVNIIFKDSTTGKYLYSQINPLYNRDSLKIISLNNDTINVDFVSSQIPNTNELYWSININPIYQQATDQASFNNEICKFFLVKYLFNQTDTIKVCFKSKYTQCGSLFDVLKVYQKNNIIGMTTNDLAVDIIIAK